MSMAHRAAPPGGSRPEPSCRVVVAIVLRWHGQTALFKRSQAVAHDRGRWHCVTGFVEVDVTPYQQALAELHEETGLRPVDLVSLQPGRVLELCDHQRRTWQVHTFSAETLVHRLVLNAEHETYRWIPMHAATCFAGRVEWLDDVLAAL